MLRKQTKIPCFVLIFDQVEIIEKCLQFLTKKADKLDIIVIENPSPHTSEIGKIVAALGATGLIRCHYLFDENITNNAFLKIFNEQLELIKQSPYVLVTDGDVTSNDTSWLEEEVRILKRNSDVYACGITLDHSNLPLQTFPDARDWIPADKSEHRDYYENVTGTHLQLMRGQGFYDYLCWVKDNGIKSVDSAMHKYCEEVLGMKWARTKHATAYHLTWDLYADLEHPYTKFRLTKNQDDTWRHDKTADYAVTEFKA